MRLPSRSAVRLLVTGPITAPCASTGAPAGLVLSADECAVGLRELSFAQSMADHDAAAFDAYLHPQAAFGTSLPKPSRGRGREAIATE